MTFYLQRDKSGRVFLDSDFDPKTNALVRTVEADHWGKARDQIKDYEFDYKQGYGFF